MALAFDPERWLKSREKPGTLSHFVRAMYREGVPLKDALESIRVRYIAEAMVDKHANQSRAGRRLGIHRNTVWRVMRTHRLSLRLLRAMVRGR